MAIDPSAITPSLAAVGARLRNRTDDDDGHQQGTFTATTRPTATEAQHEIDTAARFVALRLGRPGTSWDGNLKASAKDAVAARAALLIERSYYGDGAGGPEGDADQLGRIAREELDALLDTARDNQVGGAPFRSVTIVSVAGARERARRAALEEPEA